MAGRGHAWQGRDIRQDGVVSEYAAELADAVEAALPGWVERSVARLVVAYRGRADQAVLDQAAVAGRRAASEVGAAVRALLTADVDEQRTTPLALLRGAVRFPNEVLQAAGVPPVERDRRQEEMFPADVYDLAPANFADVDPSLAELGLAWGAAKARESMVRHGTGKNART